MTKSSSPFICTHKFIFMWQRGLGLRQDRTLDIQTTGCALWFLQAATSQRWKLGRKRDRLPGGTSWISSLLVKSLSADNSIAIHFYQLSVGTREQPPPHPKHRLCLPVRTIAQGQNCVWKFLNYSAGGQASSRGALCVWEREENACLQ